MESNKRRRSQSEVSASRETGLMRETDGHDVARFVGSSSGIHFIRTVYDRLSKRSSSRAYHLSARDLVPGEDDQLRHLPMAQGVESPWKPDEIDIQDPSHNIRPTFEQLLDWSNGYFESWHPTLPFLHAPGVLRLFEQIAQGRDPSQLDAQDLCVMKSILSISLADSRQGPPVSVQLPPYLVFKTVDEAMSEATFALSQPASMRNLQAAIAIQTFLISMLHLNSASRLGGLIVRMAFHLGLHRCPSRFPFFTPEEASIRRRVFWCIYCSERLLSQSLGLPLDIQDGDFDVCLFGEEIHGTSHESPEELQKLKLLKLISKHATIRGLIVELRHKALQNRRDDLSRSTDVQAELAKWSNEMQDEVEGIDDTDDEPRISERHCLLLSLLKLESEICLNRPMVAAAAGTPAYRSGLQACISAAKSICFLMKKHFQKHGMPKDASGPEMRLTMPLVWPSSTWVFWISAFILVYAASDNQLSFNTASRYVRVCQDALRHVAARGTRWPQHCLEAINELLVASQNIQDLPGAESGVEDENLSSRASDINTPASPAVQYDHEAGRVTTAMPSRAVTRSQALTLNYNTQTLDSGYMPDMTGEASTSGMNVGGMQPPPLGPWNMDLGNTQVDDQELMLWYQQLFDGGLSAIDKPNLAGAEIHPSVDPTWPYLT